VKDDMCRMRDAITSGRSVAVFLAALLVVLAVGAVGRADRGESVRAGAPPTRAQLTASLPRAVSIARIRQHLAALQRIADRHGGTRVTGSPGYAASVRYVRQALARAGYRPRVAPFPFVEYEELVERGEQLAPVRRPIELEAIDYSPSTPPGGIQERVVPVSGSGCSAGDFVQARGRIALVERGTCFIAQKARNAQSAGALALLVFTTERGPINATLGDPDASEIPVAAVEQSVGRSLAATPDAVVRIEIVTRKRKTSSQNVVADTHEGRGRVLLVGAHLDSVVLGPGINDNGTGVAALLEIARVVKQRGPRMAVRFAFWGAEEWGLFGSRAYADSARRQELVGYLNFDMLGSREHVRAVYEGPYAARFHAYFRGRGLSTERIDLTGRSDNHSFEQIGVPTGGLFAGGDACYHLACDRLNAVDFRILEELAAGAAFGIASLAPHR
jgi:Peptidase family M28/PA domain